MAKSESKKNEVDWAKIGKLNKPLAGNVTEPKQGVGTGTGILDFNKGSNGSSVNARSVMMPQKPKFPSVFSSAVNADGEQEPAFAMDGRADNDSLVPAEAGMPEAVKNKDKDNEVSKMETNAVNKGSRRFTDTVRDVRPSRKDNKPRNAGARKSGRDMHSGMELLALDFLLSIVENIEASEKNDITMRKLCFNELIRTNQLREVDSKALKNYGMDADAHFGKEIQCAALGELAERTSHNH